MNNDMLKIIYNALDDKKGIDIKILDISKVSTIADYFVIASGSNSSQVQALSDNVTEEMSKAGYDYKQIEGYNSSNWILIDYSDVIVHVFDADSRMFYDLERIWRDAQYVEL
jgi:ribosome-associated protein